MRCLRDPVIGVARALLAGRHGGRVMGAQVLEEGAGFGGSLAVAGARS